MSITTSEIAEAFIRAAEIERYSREHVGPKPVRSLNLGYVHSWADKAAWRKEPGDKLMTLDPYADERKAFWERLHSTPSAAELSKMESLHQWLTYAGDDLCRRALLAWARSKAGGKSFRRWCFKVEHIHPMTGRRRKNRALREIYLQLVGASTENRKITGLGVLLFTPNMHDDSDTLADSVGKRDSLNSWLSEDAHSPFAMGEPASAFAWSRKRNERRRQRKAQHRKVAA